MINRTIPWENFRDKICRDTTKGIFDDRRMSFVSGKCSVSWSIHLLVGSVALLMLCFGLSFCAVRHKPSNTHTDPLRIWQSRYSQSIHAYASPKTTTLSIVTVCWSCLLRTCTVREYANMLVVRLRHPPQHETRYTHVIAYINTFIHTGAWYLRASVKSRAQSVFAGVTAGINVTRTYRVSLAVCIICIFCNPDTYFYAISCRFNV